jgi:heterodisulfide reductase subunit C
MGTAPNQVVRLVQLGLFDRALRSPTIWLCAGCLTCTSRCPKSFDLARFMDAMRELALAAGISPPEKDVAKFHRAFLAQIRRHGRAFELGLIRDYKLSTGHFFQDIGVAPTAVFKGKIGMIPHNVKNREAVRRIFERASSRRRGAAEPPGAPSTAETTLSGSGDGGTSD